MGCGEKMNSARRLGAFSKFEYMLGLYMHYTGFCVRSSGAWEWAWRKPGFLYCTDMNFWRTWFFLHSFYFMVPKASLW